MLALDESASINDQVGRSILYDSIDSKIIDSLPSRGFSIRCKNCFITANPTFRGNADSKIPVCRAIFIQAQYSLGKITTDIDLIWFKWIGCYGDSPDRNFVTRDTDHKTSLLRTVAI